MTFRLSRLGTNSVGGSLPVPGIALTSGSQYIHGGANAFNQALLRVIVRGKRNSLPVNNNGTFAGAHSYGATGWMMYASAYPGQPAVDRGKFGGIANANTSTYLHVPYGVDPQMRTWELWIDGTRLRFAEDGIEQGSGVNTALASLITTLGIGINTRANAIGTLPYGDMTICEIQTSTVAPSRAEVLANAQARPGRLVAGAQRLWLAQQGSGPVGATWVDSLASTSLTVVGSPSYTQINPQKLAIGSMEIYGDSIAAGRNVATTTDAGWRRPMVGQIYASGRSICLVGQFIMTVTQANDPDAYKFDTRNTAAGGQALGVASSGASRLSTLAADVSATGVGSPDCKTYLGFGINDLVYRINTLAQSGPDAVNAFITDVNTALTTIRTVRTGRIYIQNVLRIGVAASGSNATVRQAIVDTNTALAQNIANWNSVHGSVSLFDACSAVTPDQAAADNTAILYDGTHETPAAKSTHGVALGDFILATA